MRVGSYDNPPGRLVASHQTRRKGAPSPGLPLCQERPRKHKVKDPLRRRVADVHAVSLVYTDEQWKDCIYTGENRFYRRARGGRGEKNKLRPVGTVNFVLLCLNQLLSHWQGEKTPASVFCPQAASWPIRETISAYCAFSGTAGVFCCEL